MVFAAPQINIAIIGLGYVGLPLARLFATKYPVVGFDINQQRVDELRNGVDSTGEIGTDLLQSVLLNDVPSKNQRGLYCTLKIENIENCNFYIITVPTPVDKHNRPDLTLLIKASETIGGILKNGDIVVYESTVYPGATEEDCVPILEKYSGLKLNQDFFVGYSPERINPGDKEHTVEKIKKIISGSTREVGEKISRIYESVITGGTYLVSSIKIAEAAKIIENSQRDINIAFVNELAKIFNLMGIDTHEVLEAAATKWNFIPFKPGLVGGHCIGVDPYYLAQKAQEYGYHPEIILVGRRLNDGMGEYVANQVIRGMIKKNQNIKNSSVLILGITYKENCSDIRNSRVIDLVRALKEYDIKVTVYDPHAPLETVKYEYGIEISNGSISKLENNNFDAIVMAVSHSEFAEIDITKIVKNNGFIYDVKGCLNKFDARL